MNVKRGFKIIKNQARCKRCGEMVESVHVHNFVPCKCFKDSDGRQGIAVDGGHNYLRRIGNLEDYEDMSETRPYTDEEVDEYNRRQMELTEKYGFNLELME